MSPPEVLLDYTDDNIRLLRAEGLSLGQIAARLGVTRGVICGKVNRLKIKLDRPKPASRINQAKSPVKPASSLIRPRVSNRNSIGVRPRGYVDRTKAELRADLKKAVENTR